MKYFLLLILLCSKTVFAITLDVGEINIPKDYSAHSTKSNPTTVVYLFGKPHPDGTNASIALSVITPPASKKFNGSNKKEIAEYLLLFLGGTQRTKSEFTKSKIEFINRQGVNLAKLSWSGIMNSRKLEGVLYCYVFNSKLVSFLAQDFVEYKKINLLKAINSIENISFKSISKGN